MRNSFPPLLLLATPLLLLTGCRFIFDEKVKGTAWTVPAISPPDSRLSALYPEMKEPVLRKKADFGICFSGGGNRSAVATLGELRALKQTGILDRARYISAVSGGTWGAAPWVFLPESQNERRFLGPLKMPRDLKPQDFETVDEQSFLASASKSSIHLPTVIARLGGDENFSKEIGHIFLERHGMNDPKRVPIYNEAQLQQKLKDPALHRNDFLVSREGRPYFIAGSAISRRDHFVGKPKELYVPVEFTSSYSGARRYAVSSNLLWRFDIPIGGGYVDNTIYDGRPFQQSATSPGHYEVTVSKSTPFPYWNLSSRLSLSDMMGASGAAPTAALPSLANLLGFPEFQYYSPAAMPSSNSRELLHTDGGAVENLGIMPLLARKVKNILVFVNTEENIITRKNESDRESKTRIPSEIDYLFGKYASHKDYSFYPYAPHVAKIWEERTRQIAEMNHVLHDPGNKKRDAMRAAFTKGYMSGSTLIYCDTYRVMDSDYYALKGGWDVNICWVVLGPAGFVRDAGTDDRVTVEETEWFSQLHSPAKDLLRNNKELENFPYYKTFLNNGRNLIALSPIQATTLAHYTSYSVKANERKIKQHLLRGD